MVLLWGFAFGALFISSDSKPYEVTIAGLCLGLVGGIMQWKAFNGDPTPFIKAISLLEVRAALKATVWGRRYLLFLKLAAILLLMVVIARPKNILTDIPTGYFAMMFLREIVTLKPTINLEKIAIKNQLAS
jgi:hypothetical protein